MTYVIGVDIGGTFTDCIVVDSNGDATIGKATSTTGDLSTGVLESIRTVAEQLNVDTKELLSATTSIYHGCTVGTNALVERRTAKVGLLATRGHGDAIFMMQAGERLRGAPASLLAHVSQHMKDEPLVSKDLVQEVDERMALDGSVVVPFNEASARESISRLLAQDVEAFAVSLLWSSANSAHEVRVRELIEERAPGAFVSVSHEVAPRPGEYPRTVATVINSLIGPVMAAYLGELQAALATAGYRHELQLMSCSGGVINLEDARLRPVLTIGSGPAAGVMGARTLALAAAASTNGDGGANAGVVTTDMGGTTLDVGVIRGAEPLRRSTSRHGQYEYFVPTVDVRSIGAGGGSIIRYDDSLGSLTVGPQSAGSYPGPACYGRGGSDPTITDADVVLGYLNPEYFLEGRMALDTAAANAALELVGKPLGMGPEETAAAAVRIVQSQIADAIRLASVQQGYDPREFILYAYGGAGPVHASGYAPELGIKRVVVPLSDFASGWSAFGVATSEAVVVREIGRALNAPFDPEVLNETWEALETEVRSRLIAQGAADADIAFERLVEMKYTMQVHQIPVRAPAGHYDAETSHSLLRLFDEEYERVFGKGAGYSAAGYALTALRVIGRADIVGYKPRSEPLVESGASPTPTGERDILVYDAGSLERVATSTYDGREFKRGASLEGPAIIEFPDTTIVLQQGQSASVDQFNSVNILTG